MKDNFMLTIIPHDFSVELLAQSDNKALFYALRKNVWHFVLLESRNGVNNITQLHVPRFIMAMAVKSLLTNFNKSFKNGLRYRLWGDVDICIRDKKRFDIDLMLTDNGLPTSFSKVLKQDLLVLDRAEKKVITKDGLYILPRSKTYSGNPVSSTSRGLIKAIAFERESLGKLDAKRNFGIYSAFCTMRDFCTDAKVSISELKDHVVGQFQYAPESLPKEDLELLMKVQKVFLSKPIWGTEINMEKEQAVQILAEGMAKLTKVQRAQFVLMNGMHAAGLFLPLAVITKLIDFRKYIWYKTLLFQPDSKEEQKLRTETTYIELLGELK